MGIDDEELVRGIPDFENDTHGDVCYFINFYDGAYIVFEQVAETHEQFPLLLTGHQQVAFWYLENLMADKRFHENQRLNPDGE